MPYLLLILSWTIYFFLHSWLASNSVKMFFEKRLRAWFHFYRLAYTAQSVIGLVAVLLVNGMIQTEYFFQSRGVVRYLSLVLATFGVLVINAAFKQYKLSSFIGLRKEDPGFSSNGILKYVRHPIYSGVILLVLGFFLFSPNPPTLVSSLCIFVYLIVGIRLEERKLIQQFGDTYLLYKNKVPSLMPKLFRSAKK
jgi:methanethiol S-methyltransferase